MLNKILLIIKILEGVFNILYGFFVVIGQIIHAVKDFLKDEEEI